MENNVIKKDILAGTFIKSDMVPRKLVKEIVENFATEKLFIFLVEEENEKKFLVTFNVRPEESSRFTAYKDKHKNTVTLHRKKESNTLYTINSLNEIISMQNKTEDKQNLDWSAYQNSCILLGKNKELKVLKTRLYDLVEY